MGEADVRGRAISGMGRRLCVVRRGGRCFACGGRRGPGGDSRREHHDETASGRGCPVCGGRGRSMVVDSGDGRTGFAGGST
jgi:hypothetical protein